MSIDYLLPKLAMAMNEGTINEWLVQSGDYVDQGAPLVVVETEKVSYDLEAPESGYFQILVEAGKTVPVESLIGRFSADATAAASPTATNSATTDGVDAISPADNTATKAPVQHNVRTNASRIKASPLARKLAAQQGLELGRINGSGPGGRIVKRDVLAAAQAHEQIDSPLRELTRIPVQSGPRAAIARRMMESLHSSAQLSSHWESDVTELLATRARLLEHEEQLGARISVNALLLKALVCAIKQVPIVNSALIDDDIVIYDSINIGIAIALPGNTQWDSKLVVPVLKNANNMGLAELNDALKALIAKAHSGELTPDDMRDSTVTFSSTAGIAPPGNHSTPILNQPNSLLLGPSTIIERASVVDGNIAIRQMLPLSLTFDHRVLDGEPVARFSKALHDYLQCPSLMLA